jgi:hypothetical protein
MRRALFGRTSRNGLLWAALVAASLAAAVASSGNRDQAADPLLGTALGKLQNASAQLGADITSTYNSFSTAAGPAKHSLSASVASRLAAAADPARAALKSAGDAVVSKAGSVNVVQPLVKHVTDVVEPKAVSFAEAVTRTIDATAGRAKKAAGAAAARAINATAAAVDAALAAGVAAVGPALFPAADALAAHINAAQDAADKVIEPLLVLPSHHFFDKYGALVTDGHPVREALRPVIRLVNQRINSKGAILDGPVADATAPLTGALARAFESVSVQIEGPVAQQVAAPRAAARGVVARISDFVDGPGYRLSQPIRTVANHAITRVAKFVEGADGSPPYALNSTAGGGVFINHIGDFVGRRMVPAVGRIGSAVFGVIPKPAPRDRSQPGRPTDPVYPSAAPSNPTGAPSGAAAFGPACLLACAQSHRLRRCTLDGLCAHCLVHSCNVSLP